jgi:hypothetical protein
MRQRDIVTVIVILLGLSLACGPSSNSGGGKPPAQTGEVAKVPEAKPQRLESYTIKGMTFSYYLIPAGLSREDLIATAQGLHDFEPRAQLILVDDTAELQNYINYAKEFSRGNIDAYYPLEWAKRHVIANLLLYVSGKWMLCEGVGANEIAQLR